MKRRLVYFNRHLNVTFKAQSYLFHLTDSRVDVVQDKHFLFWKESSSYPKIQKQKNHSQKTLCLLEIFSLKKEYL